MMKLSDTLKLGLLHALSAVVVGLGLFSAYQNFQLRSAENKISLQQTTITNQKLAIDGLVSEVTYLSREVS